MDNKKLLVLQESFEKSLREFVDESEFNYGCKPEHDLKEYIHLTCKSVFYTLDEFKNAIIKALKD
jgi:hypothetical protein